MRLATVSVRRAPLPAKRRRKARPAGSATSTVAAMTMNASATDRRNAPPRSPTNCVPNKRPNQCSEAPFIGKVRPPSGPWNDRIRMVAVGP